MDPRLTFRLKPNGWAELFVDTGEAQYFVTGISYLSNALDDLLRVGLSVATHHSIATAQLFHEPGSTLLVAETSWWTGGDWESGARLSVIDDPDPAEDGRGSCRPTESPRRFCVSYSSPDKLALALLRMAEAVEAEHGHRGYAALWRGALGFPVRAVAALREALAAPASERLDYGG
jgi:hypothetical protein